MQTSTRYNNGRRRNTQARQNRERGGGGQLPPVLAAGGGQKVLSNQQKIVLPLAQYKLSYNITTAVGTVLLTNSSRVYCIFVLSQEFKITNFFFGGGFMTPCNFMSAPAMKTFRRAWKY